MLNKLPIKAIITGLALVVLVGTVVYANSPATLPTNPIYAIKKGWEALTLTLATGPEAKAQKMIDLANTRLAEAKTLASQAQNNPNVKPAIASAIQESQVDLTQAASNAQQISDPTKRKVLLDDISKEADQNKKEIENEIENEAELENGDKEKVDESKKELDKTKQDSESSGD